MARDGEMFYIVRAYFTHIQFGVHLQMYMNVEDVPWHIIVQMKGHLGYL